MVSPTRPPKRFSALFRRSVQRGCRLLGAFPAPGGGGLSPPDSPCAGPAASPGFAAQPRRQNLQRPGWEDGIARGSRRREDGGRGAACAWRVGAHCPLWPVRSAAAFQERIPSVRMATVSHGEHREHSVVSGSPPGPVPSRTVCTRPASLVAAAGPSPARPPPRSWGWRQRSGEVRELFSKVGSEKGTCGHGEARVNRVSVRVSGCALG